MIYADRETGTRATATPGARGTCPGCGGEVLAKCGTTVVWHWAHVGRDDCDDWAERDSSWHRAWQSVAPPERREVVTGDHRADLVTAGGWVVELQHSVLAADVVRARERHYGPRMVWVWDAQDAYATDRLEIRPRQGHVTFRWRHPRKTLAACRRPVLLDLDGRTLLRVRRIYPEAPCGGWGHLLPADVVRGWITGTASIPTANGAAA